MSKVVYINVGVLATRGADGRPNNPTIPLFAAARVENDAEIPAIRLRDFEHSGLFREIYDRVIPALTEYAKECEQHKKKSLTFGENRNFPHVE